MSKHKNFSSEEIKLLKRYMARQTFGATIGYLTAAFMLLSTIDVIMAHDAKKVPDAILWSTLGILDCYLADKLRQRHNKAKSILKELKQQQNQNQK